MATGSSVSTKPLSLLPSLSKLEEATQTPLATSLLISEAQSQRDVIKIKCNEFHKEEINSDEEKFLKGALSKPTLAQVRR